MESGPDGLIAPAAPPRPAEEERVVGQHNNPVAQDAQGRVVVAAAAPADLERQGPEATDGYFYYSDASLCADCGEQDGTPLVLAFPCSCLFMLLLIHHVAPFLSHWQH